MRAELLRELERSIDTHKHTCQVQYMYSYGSISTIANIIYSTREYLSIWNEVPLPVVKLNVELNRSNREACIHEDRLGVEHIAGEQRHLCGARLIAELTNLLQISHSIHLINGFSENMGTPTSVTVQYTK